MAQFRATACRAERYSEHAEQASWGPVAQLVFTMRSEGVIKETKESSGVGSTRQFVGSEGKRPTVPAREQYAMHRADQRWGSSR